MKKKLSILAAVLLCCLALTACGGKKTETVHLPDPAPTSAPTSVPTMAPATPAPMSEADQRMLIERFRGLWEPDLSYETWFSAITDLDHNGRLEVLTASLQGSGLFTWVNCYEVNETFTNLNHCPDDTQEGQAWPDIIKDSITSYRDPATGRYTYVCEDYLRDGAAHYWTGLMSFCLTDSHIEVRQIASMDEVYTDQNNSTRRYFDEHNAEITESAYLGAEQRVFAGQEKGTLSLSWTQLQPASTPAPVVTAQATAPVQPQFTAQPQANGPVTVTKNPTSESLAVGGKTWFIAHASNASSLTWILTSPQGQTYTLQQAMAANPGLSLEALPEDTLAVSSVPASLDGWSVQARFDGPGGSAVSAPATISVDDSLSVYGGVISAYYRAYNTGSNTPEYAFNNNLSEFIGSARHVGYALQDLNGDGVQELMIAGILDDSYTELVLFDLYTLENGQPVQLATSRARSRYFLRSDGSVLNEGSNGAGNSIFVVNRLYGSQLTPVESAFTWFEGKETDGYYHQTDGYHYEPRSFDETLAEQQFTQLITGWESSITFPQLTQIA